MQTHRFLCALAALALLIATGTLLYKLGFVRFSYPDSVRFPIRGIDVSHHQGPIDWQKIPDSGIQFAFIKASEGSTFTDPLFVTNSQAINATDIVWAPYHFFTFCSPGADQAKHFRSVIAGTHFQLQPAIDIEFTGNCRSWQSLETVRNELRAFLHVLQDVGVRPTLYVTSRSHRQVLAGEFLNYDLWVRSLFGEPNARAFRNWSYWQFADNARLPGIEGPVDLNVYCCEDIRRSAY